MGGAKQYLIEVQERGYGDVSGFACDDCLGIGPIQKAIDFEVFERGDCSYCGSNTRVMSVEDLLDLVTKRIRTEWEDLYEADLPIDEDTGQPFLNQRECSTSEVFSEEGFEPTKKLLDDLCGAIHTKLWCELNPISLTESSDLRLTWDSFCSEVRTRYRFTFFRIPDHQDEHTGEVFSIAGWLDRLKNVFETLDPWVSLPANTQYLRARPEKGVTQGRDLGTAPPDHASPNRMSPEGIGMFYGAFDEETCIREICRIENGRYHECSIGIFRANRELVLLDLTKKYPTSVFEVDNPTVREFSKFLHRFQDEISLPVDPSKKSHVVEYAPTQILTEYFRFSSIASLEKPVDGIIYNSATNPGAKCVVLFFENQECGDDGDPGVVLGLVSRSDRAVLFEPSISLTKLKARGRR